MVVSKVVWVEITESCVSGAELLSSLGGAVLVNDVVGKSEDEGGCVDDGVSEELEEAFPS